MTNQLVVQEQQDELICLLCSGFLVFVSLQLMYIVNLLPCSYSCKIHCMVYHHVLSPTPSPVAQMRVLRIFSHSSLRVCINTITETRCGHCWVEWLFYFHCGFNHLQYLIWSCVRLSSSLPPCPQVSDHMAVWFSVVVEHLLQYLSVNISRREICINQWLGGEWSDLGSNPHIERLSKQNFQKVSLCFCFTV